jgi:prevent-host-death family protein
MTTLGAARFKATCLEVLERVRKTGERIVITRRGKAIAQLGPAPSEMDAVPQYGLRGTVEVLGDIIGPAVPLEMWNAAGNNPAPRRRKSKR